MSFYVSQPEDRAGWDRQMLNNGVRADQFIEAAASFEHPLIVEALFDIVRRAENSDIFYKSLNEAVVARDRDVVFERMREFISTPPTVTGPFGGRYYILRAAAKHFPRRAAELWPIYRAHGTLETLRATVHALSEPEKPQRWMRDYLASLLDDTTDTGWAYGPDYDRQPIRVCDEAAQILARFYLDDVRFEYEKDPQWLDEQIAKIRRVLAGEAGVSFEAPAYREMPESLPTTKALRVAAFDMSFWRVFDGSNENMVRVGGGKRGENGYIYQIIDLDLESGEETGRVTIDTWNGGVNIIRPMHGERIFCWHDEGGSVIVRDIKTGEALKRMTTPFRNVFHANDDLSITVSHMSPMLVTHDQKFLVTFTEDGALHSINVETGERAEEWKYTGEKQSERIHGDLRPIRGTSRFVLENVPSLSDGPLRIWDQDERTMTELRKVPFWGWDDAVGDIAWQSVNSQLTPWNLAKRKEIAIPVSDLPIAQIECDLDQRALFILRVDGSVDVFRIVNGESLEPIHRLEPPTDEELRTSIQLTEDVGILYWIGAPPYRYDDDGKLMERPERTVVAVFDVGDLLE